MFTAESVRGILDGSKTQTRRPIKPQPVYYETLSAEASPAETAIFEGEIWECSQYSNNVPDSIKWRKQKPKYQVGDLIWVRESFKYMNLEKTVVGFAASPDETCNDGRFIRLGHWKSPRYLPKRFARLWLEITRTRDERLQDISEGDIKAEGINLRNDGFVVNQIRFYGIWDAINKERGFGWDSNPVVSAIEFKKIEAPTR